jgi:hypothetical protein
MRPLNLNRRLKPRHVHLYTITPVDIGNLDGMEPNTLALQAVDSDGRLVYVHVTPHQLYSLFKRIGESVSTAGFARMIAHHATRNLKGD